jgi:hypothetical protein
MPQKFGQIAQPDLMCFISGAAASASFFAASAAAAMTEN